jgi:hypothetical protein
MKTQWKLALVGVMCSAMAIVGISLAGSASAAESTTVLRPLTVTAAALNCRNHSAESKPVSGKVVVPTNYCYDPTTNNHRGWHDYCTHAPDSVYVSSGAPFGVGSGTVDFRGPCARHDMCLQSTHSHSKCDGPLLSNLKQNCSQRFASYNPARYKCDAVAYTYYLVIKAYTVVS